MQGVGFFLFFSVVASVPLDTKKQDGVAKKFQPVPINPADNIIQNVVNNGALLSGQLFKTVRRYYCSFSGSDQETNVLLYGTNGWSFPRQDVNLTLSYPTANHDNKDMEDYVITGYEMIMFTDGSDSSGYITAGGLLRQEITLNFIMSDITMLTYEFWLYGVPATQAATTYVNYEMC